jgi:hypothetical protein
MNFYDMETILPAQESPSPDLSSSPPSQTETVLASDAHAPTVGDVFIGLMSHPVHHLMGR